MAELSFFVVLFYIVLWIIYSAGRKRRVNEVLRTTRQYGEMRKDMLIRSALKKGNEMVLKNGGSFDETSLIYTFPSGEQCDFNEMISSILCEDVLND